MKKEELRIVFMGTPEFAVGTFKALVDGGYHVVAAVTQPDKPVGRHGSVLQPSAVKQYALEHQIPVLQPEKMKDPVFLEQLRSLRADLQVVVAFRMLPEVVWSMPRFGTFNVHASLLPQYRGAAPINWAIINGETETGVTTFFLDHQIDTGRIIMQKNFRIPDDADVEYVYDGLMTLGAQLAVETVDRILENDGEFATVPQTESAHLHDAPKIFKETCRINWNQSAKGVYDFIRGLSPYPGAGTELSELDNERKTLLKIFKTSKTSRPSTGRIGEMQIEDNHLYVSTFDTQLEILELQLSGKKRMPTKDFLNGFHGYSLMLKD
jgi:methionyl-tRNA formyltransferase